MVVALTNHISEIKKKTQKYSLFHSFFFSSPYADIDAESQNFLPEYHLDKKKYATEYVRLPFPCLYSYIPNFM